MRGRIVDPFAASGGEKSVLVAMSGGVDSSVAALLLVKAGFRTVGITMKNYCYAAEDTTGRSCCSVEAIQDARRECDRIGIAHHVADVEEIFKREVVDDFVSEYRNARTPNPCARCNTRVRFKTLAEYANILGLDFVATGHYARVFEREGGERFIARAVHRQKDQSYFLAGVRGRALERAVFPLGGLDKPAVRELAKEASMAVADKSDSQEVCFVPDGELRPFLKSHDVRFVAGDIENTEGEVVGKHLGLGGFTVGQRRNLGVAAGEPQYVVRLDRERNVVVIGGAEDLMQNAAACTFEWVDPSIVEDPAGVSAQIRYRHAAAPVARLRVDGSAGWVEFESPQRAVCPGQSLVLYRDDVVLGCGAIDEPDAHRRS